MSDKKLDRASIPNVMLALAMSSLPVAVASAQTTPVGGATALKTVVAQAAVSTTTATSIAPKAATPVATTTAPKAATPVATTKAPKAATPVAATGTTTKAATTTVKTALLAAVSKWGDYYTPFAADSLWNSRPITPAFGTFVIPKSSYYPAVSSGAYSTGVFLSADTDGPMTIYPIAGKTGIIDQDAEINRPSITIPHWPAGTVPAAGLDGHADIVDPVTGIIHSFFKLKQENGRWVAQLYAWMPLAGRGWGSPDHYYQGARAVGIPASAGLMRRHELNDGKATFQHALAMSLTYNGLSAAPNYIYPSTNADTPTATPNTGQIPEGALLMLPPDYDTSKIASADLRKVAETLKLFGAYVVDRNTGTPFAIYVENDSGYSLHKGTWDNAVAAELDRIRANLRQVVGAQSWVDGNGNAMAAPLTAKAGTLLATATTTTATTSMAALSPPNDMNMLSMRGAWQVSSGTVKGIYNSWTQALEFPVLATAASQSNSNGRGLSKVSWAKPLVDDYLRFTSIATGGATLRMIAYGSTGVVFDSGNLNNGEFRDFKWPLGGWIALYARNGTLGVPSSVKGALIKIPSPAAAAAKTTAAAAAKTTAAATVKK